MQLSIPLPNLMWGRRRRRKRPRIKTHAIQATIYWGGAGDGSEQRLALALLLRAGFADQSPQWTALELTG